MIWLQENWIIAVVGLVIAVVLLWWLFGRAKPQEIAPPAAEPAKPANAPILASLTIEPVDAAPAVAHAVVESIVRVDPIPAAATPVKSDAAKPAATAS